MESPTRTFKTPRITPKAVVAGLLFGLVLGLAACGGSGGSSSSQAPDYGKALAGSPPTLAALHKQGGKLLDGGMSAFDSRIEGLHGYPAVVNIWGSWCGPCVEEFPVFQKTSAALGKKVAFLGVDSDDDADAAATFLRDNPVPYPSYVDPDKKITDDLGATIGLPGTAFYDAKGNRTYTRQGPYTSEADLKADIQKYAVDGQTG